MACQTFAPQVASQGVRRQLDMDHEALRAWVCGISAQEQQGLFQDFSQFPLQSEHHGPDMAVRGAGLGLAWWRRLVQQMQGDMGLRSTVGAGATVWFTMPVLAWAVAARCLAPAAVRAAAPARSSPAAHLQPCR